MDMNLLRRFKYWCIRNYYSLFKKDKIHKIKFSGYNPKIGEIYTHDGMGKNGIVRLKFLCVGKNKFIIIEGYEFTN